MNKIIYSIEPFVYKTKLKDSYFFYNTLNYKSIVIKKTKDENLSNFLDKLFIEKNMGVVCLSEDIVNNNYEINKFVEQSLNTHIARINKKNLCDKSTMPVQFIKENNVQNSYKYLFNKDNANGKKIVDALKEITIYINGDNRILYNDAYKQFHYPTPYCENKIDPNKFSEIANDIENTNVSLFSIFGIESFSNEEIIESISVLNKKKYNKLYNLLFVNDIPSIRNTLALILSESSNHINIIIDNVEYLTDLFSNFIDEQLSKNINFTFIVKNDYELQKILAFTENRSDINISLLPYYDKKNLSFFKENVFINEDELLGIELNMNNILSNQHINTSFFGKLIILPDGKVYSNINKKPIGSINNDSIHELVYLEYLNNRNWFRVKKNVLPCKQCIYKSICPPLSNYEFFIGKSDLCHIKF